jgi:hypothetical protein
MRGAYQFCCSRILGRPFLLHFSFWRIAHFEHQAFGYCHRFDSFHPTSPFYKLNGPALALA